MTMESPFANEPIVRKIYGKNAKVPVIYDICKTVKMLSETGKSFSRFGDGEFMLMTNKNVNHVFQKKNEKLSDRLVEILSSNNENVEIGINRIYFYTEGNSIEHPYIENFMYKRGYGKVIVKNKYLNFMKREHYYDSVFSIPYHHYVLSDLFFEEYFESVKNIWRDKDVILVTGDLDILKYQNSVFDTSKSMKIIEISKRDAYDYHNRILRYVRNSIPNGKSKNDLVILLACGLEATVLAYDLGKDGDVQAIDIGHLAREYDSFKKRVIPYSTRDKRFFEH